MKKIKLFGGSASFVEIERQVNEFTANELIDVIDIKLSESMSLESYSTTILIIYKDK